MKGFVYPVDCDAQSTGYTNPFINHRAEPTGAFQPLGPVSPLIENGIIGAYPAAGAAGNAAIRINFMNRFTLARYRIRGTISDTGLTTLAGIRDHISHVMPPCLQRDPTGKAFPGFALSGGLFVDPNRFLPNNTGASYPYQV